MHYRIRQVLKKILLMTKSVNILWQNLPNGVYVFNYHRIGDVTKTEFDRAVFSCSVAALETHLIAIKNNFEIITSKQLRTIINEASVIKKRYAIITFDDGYYDNYSEAFPVLKKHNVPGIFYLPTEFIDSDKVPWWDEIAYLLRNSSGQSYSLPKQDTKFDLVKLSIDATIQKIIFQAKRIDGINILDVLADIRDKFPQAHEKLQAEENMLFMNWQQAKEMSENGMEIGSHTLSHQILSQLTSDEQKIEITISKEVIEKNIGQEIFSIAYPVGRYHCYTEETCQLSEEAGYIIGFNNEPGKNKTINNPYNINRTCVDANDVDLLKFNSCF